MSSFSFQPQPQVMLRFAGLWSPLVFSLLFPRTHLSGGPLWRINTRKKLHPSHFSAALDFVLQLFLCSLGIHLTSRTCWTCSISASFSAVPTTGEVKARQHLYSRKRYWQRTGVLHCKPPLPSWSNITSRAFCFPGYGLLSHRWGLYFFILRYTNWYFNSTTSFPRAVLTSQSDQLYPCLVIMTFTSLCLISKL